jgi:release factor glutamine methyltransferase
VGSIYTPAEDSYLLQRHVKRLVEGRVLDMGTGSGIQAVTAAQKPDVDWVVATDINPSAIEAAKRRAKKAGVIDKIDFVVSDLFDKIEGDFDWIIFNPPYLPSDGGIFDPTWDGGKIGGETIQRFLNQAKKYLTLNGSILLIYSSESGALDQLEYQWKILEEENLFFETVYCALLTPT